MLSAHARLAAAGLALPPISAPQGVYTPAVRVGDLVQVSGQIPLHEGRPAATGRVGAGISVEQGRELSARCVLASLAAIDAVAGLDNVTRVIKLVAYVASADGFTGQHAVADGAAEVLVALFGEAGRHASTAVGVLDGPLDAPVEIELLVEVRADV
jgi:enamine deaminase RidA (YjgF/YER057c/UK114 family)